MVDSADLRFMSEALALAQKGLYTTDPNPNVGCVLVKNGIIIGRGWHKRAGDNHAEVNALQDCREQAKGATAYVTLEPCSHFGKTPPCCDALIAAGVCRVVVAMRDPNPLVSGRGLKKMQAAGIAVEYGVLEHDAYALNRGFFNRMQTGIPWVSSKMAMSLDARTAMKSGESQWITSPEARADVHRLRAASSAVLTGIDTVIADDCQLSARLTDEELLQPVRLVLDSNLRLPLDAKICQQSTAQTWVFTGVQQHPKIAALQDAGLQVHTVPLTDKGRIDLPHVLSFLGEKQINALFIEAGATLNGALMQAGLVNEWIIYMAACALGHEGRALLNLPDMRTMNDKIKLKINDVRRIGPDIKMILNR